MPTTATYIKTKLQGKTVYKGKIVFTRKGKYIWSATSQIARLNKIDAKADAELLKADLIERGGIK